MIRKFNYTKREKIRRRDTLISVDCSNGKPELNVHLRLEKYHDVLPMQGVVYLEAYHRIKYERFQFGTVGQLRAPEDLTLQSFSIADKDNIRFRVKVVDESDVHGRIIALAEGIGAISNELLQASRLSLLQVTTDNLDQRIWELELDGEIPSLILNSRLSDPYGLLKNNDIFFSAIYPEIVRQILSDVLLTNLHEEYFPSDECDDWQYLWLCFGRKLLGEKWPKRAHFEKCKDWIERVVNNFCRSNRVLQRLESAGE